jgi:hypothetical protein
MFFNRRYGSIGLFILPIATTSIFSTLFGTGTAISGIVSRLSNFLLKYRTVGLQEWHPSFSIDWFFLNTTVISFLTISALLLTLVILYLSLKMTEGRFKFGKEIIYYLVLYVFIVPLWLIKALFNTVFRKQVSWR